MENILLLYHLLVGSDFQFLHTSASLIWRSLLKNIPFIHHWLCWKPGSGHAIHIGRDAILGLGSKAFLSSGLLNYLRNIKVFFLFQAQHTSDGGFTCTNWKSSSDLGLSGELAQEWKSYCSALLEQGFDFMQWKILFNGLVGTILAY
jgi:hypothetical protein